ncbi:MAG: MoxR family ATPase [Verrucomicrobiota bacterium]
MNESPTPPASLPPAPSAPTPAPVPDSLPASALPPSSPPGNRSQEGVESGLWKEIHAEVKKVFVGQDEVLDQMLACLLAGGHVLLEGKPGLGKTHLVLALAKSFGGSFGRIQFTPDLMPSDVTGHTIYEMGSQSFHLRKGPVFANLLLADEINRAPAKTQAALLEVMQETQVTIDGESIRLEPPFMTIATQNPIEQEGTYPLPEAQLDRFLMKVLIDYPDESEEKWIVSAVASGASGRGLTPQEVGTVASKEAILRAQEQVAAVQAVDEVVDYAVRIVRATRGGSGIHLGAGTRGAIGLVRVAKAYAVMEGRNFIVPHDVKRAVLPVLRHRLTLSPELFMSGETVDQVLRSLVDAIDAPRG